MKIHQNGGIIKRIKSITYPFLPAQLGLEFGLTIDIHNLIGLSETRGPHCRNETEVGDLCRVYHDMTHGLVVICRRLSRISDLTVTAALTWFEIDPLRVCQFTLVSDYPQLFRCYTRGERAHANKVITEFFRIRHPCPLESPEVNYADELTERYSLLTG